MSNAHLFRKLNAQQDQMIRAAMPRTSASDPVPLPVFAQDRSRATWSLGRRYTQKANFTLAEVANA